MDSVVDRDFFLNDFSPRDLSFIPDLNCVLASDRCGKLGCIDVVTGLVHRYPGM